ncbi:MAG: hypothetical protein ACK4NA_12710 [Alphaproteobacteria bacterium]
MMAARKPWQLVVDGQVRKGCTFGTASRGMRFANGKRSLRAKHIELVNRERGVRWSRVLGTWTRHVIAAPAAAPVDLSDQWWNR